MKQLFQIIAILAFVFGSGCALLQPPPEEIPTRERLRAFPRLNVPTKEQVTVYWNDHLVPFIEADHDDDLAFTLGLVHAYLRLSQMEFYRLAANGRLAELFGPFVTNIDHSIRILGLKRIGLDLADSLPQPTLDWLKNYVRGINFYVRHEQKRPHDSHVLGLKKEPWTVADILTLSRLFGVDVNWLTYARLLPLWGSPEWPNIWKRYLKNGKMSIPSFGTKSDTGLDTILGSLGRSGSNSLVVGPKKSATGAAIMANDPHLGITIPNLWIIAGYTSPSYHVVGLMLPGLPAVALGRNEHIAWGGTNMRSASSDLFDVSRIDQDKFHIIQEKLLVRWWFDKTVAVRLSPWGPVITDSEFFRKFSGPSLALHWVGEQKSDEIGALLAANRSKDWTSFQRSWKDYGVSGQNILYADRDGNIGQLLAVKLPRRSYSEPPDLFLNPFNPEHTWKGLATALDLPNSFNPPEGYLASANNMPVDTSPNIGFLYTENDRIRRLKEVLGKNQTIDVKRVRGLQQDVVPPAARTLRDLVVGVIEPDRDNGRLAGALEKWDGRLAADSRGALAFELTAFHLASAYYRERLSKPAANAILGSAGILEFLLADLAVEQEETKQLLVKKALEAAEKDFARYENWGRIHRLKLRHILGRLPVLGKRYRFGDFPAGGGATTLMKTSHGLTNKPHSVTYGSTARHISDLSDPDANWFVLLGGQDGWLNSPHLTDQVDMWHKGKYLHIPLRLATVKKTFPHRTILIPNRNDHSAH